MLPGKKTYIIAVIMLLHAMFGAFLGYAGLDGGVDPQTAIQEALTALGLMGLRKGIAGNGGTQ